MRHLLGYLQLEDPAGNCVELVNGARTLALMAREECRAHPSWHLSSSPRAWDGLSCWAFDSGQYGETPALWDDPGGAQDPNPWEDPDDPRTFEVAGFLPDAPGAGVGVIIESPVEERVMSSPRVEPLELLITGTIVAGSSRGEQVFLSWLTRTLTDPYSFLQGWKATVFTHCPDPDEWAGITDPFDLPVVDPGAPVVTAWDDPSPATLEAFAGATEWPLDSGIREVFDVRFKSIDPLSDQPLFPHCVGRRIAIRFTVGRHRWYDRPRTLAELGGAGSWDAGETYATALDVTDGTPPDEFDPDAGAPGLAVPDRVGAWSGLISRPGRWKLPDAVLRVSTLTPPRPASLTDRVVVTVHNPSVVSTVYNARIVFWEAFVGYPRPDSVVGDAFYRNRTPDAELRIVRLEPSETITFDGRTGRTKLTRPGVVLTAVAGRVEGPAGVRVDAPVLRCDERYWVAVELSADAGSYADLDLEVSVDAAEQDTP